MPIYPSSISLKISLNTREVKKNLGQKNQQFRSFRQMWPLSKYLILGQKSTTIVLNLNVLVKYAHSWPDMIQTDTGTIWGLSMQIRSMPGCCITTIRTNVTWPSVTSVCPAGGRNKPYIIYHSVNLQLMAFQLINYHKAKKFDFYREAGLAGMSELL